MFLDIIPIPESVQRFIGLALFIAAVVALVFWMTRRNGPATGGSEDRLMKGVGRDKSEINEITFHDGEQ
jgi:hypothetical protein